MRRGSGAGGEPGGGSRISASDAAAARHALARTAMFAPDAIEGARIVRLRGLTNRVYKVEIGDEVMCLRVPGAGTEAIIDRAAEAFNARRAADAGLTPPILHFGADGVMVTHYLGDGFALSSAALRAGSGAVERVAGALRILHDKTADFATDFAVFARIDSYLSVLAQRGARLPHALPGLLRGNEAIRSALAAHAVALRPCHCDPTGENLLDTGERVWLIDWEYSAMNEPFWDLAYLSLMAGFDAPLDRRLSEAYLGRPAGTAEASRMALWRFVCGLLAALWALVQHSGGNRAGDFLGYAATTFAECGHALASPAFAADLDTVRLG